MKKIFLFIIIVFLSDNICSSAVKYDISLPGETMVWKLWQREILSVVYSRAAKTVKSCNDFSITDTKLVSETNSIYIDESGRVIDGNWEEVWYVNACGTNVSVPVKLKQVLRGYRFTRFNRLKYKVGDGEIINSIFVRN